MFNRLFAYTTKSNRKAKAACRRRRRGSALILTVVLTVLLALIGVFFVMASRVGEVASATQVEYDDLDEAVEAVINQIQYELWEDLFVPDTDAAGGDPDTYFDPKSMNLLADMSQWAPHPTEGDFRERPDFSKLDIDNEPWDSPAVNPHTNRRSDPWLASLMPEHVSDGGTIGLGEAYKDDVVVWPYITDLTGSLAVLGFDKNLQARVVGSYQETVDLDPNTPEFEEGMSADADGDGISDSRWVRIGALGGSKGQGVYAAIRITDNCGRVNLNTAYRRTDAPSSKYLSSVSLLDFMRTDNPTKQQDDFMGERRGGASISPEQYHENMIPFLAEGDYSGGFYGIAEELEMRNRFLMSSPYTARFERYDITKGTFAANGGKYPVITDIAHTSTDFSEWAIRIDPNNFNATSGAYDAGPDQNNNYKYDRRPVCTFYSYDRNLRQMAYPDPDYTDFYDPSIYYYDENTRRFEVRRELLGVVVPDGALDMGVRLSNNEGSRRWILQLLYLMRAYYLNRGLAKEEAARAAAQFAANVIDYTDDGDNGTEYDEGPFFSAEFGGQLDEIINVSDPNSGTGMNSSTFLTADIIDEIEREQGVTVTDPNGVSDLADYLDFGLPAGEMVLGYERQPFITEVYRKLESPSPGAPSDFVIELTNPYENPNGNMDLTGWTLKCGSFEHQFVSSDGAVIPPSSGGVHGRLVITSDAMIPVATGAKVVVFSTMVIDGPVRLYKPGPEDQADPAKDVMVDYFDVTDLLDSDPIAPNYERSLQRSDAGYWTLADAGIYHTFDNSSSLGAANSNFPAAPTAKNFPLRAGDINRGVESAWELASIALTGHIPTGDRLDLLTWRLQALDADEVNLDLTSNDTILAYLGFANLYGLNRIPGRINLNTATREVIRAAIPDEPSWPVSYDTLSKNIVNYRDTNEVFEKVTDLLQVADVIPAGATEPLEKVSRYSVLANKFTVRSDVFSADVLVRLGVRGPQKRVIVIFDRTNVYNPWQKPRIVAVHPVPAP